MRIDSSRALGLALLVWFCATLTLGLQSWVGDATIYSKRLETKREELHFAILANQAPREAGWGAVGALTVQKRVAVVYLAEQIRKSTDLAVGKIYKSIDTLFLFIALLALFFYLRRWLADIYCLIGLLYFSAMLPFTYFFQLFHPWDRLQLAMWIGLLYLAMERKILLLALGLVLSIFVKYDTIVIPLFYFLANYQRDQWRRVVLESMLLSILAYGTYYLLGQWFPSPADETNFSGRGAMSMAMNNLQAMAQMGPRFPPLVALALPLFLACCFWPSKDRVTQASVLFAWVLTVMFFLFSQFEEVRAQMIVLVLVLPSALLSLDRFLSKNLMPQQTLERIA